jgi:hypothetical protein
MSLPGEEGRRNRELAGWREGEEREEESKSGRPLKNK